MFRDDWPRVRQRYEAWWEGEPLESPLVRVTAPRAPATAPGQGLPAEELPPAGEEALFAWMTDPERVLPRLERMVEATYYAGEAFPWVDPVFLGWAAIQAAYLGAPYRVDPETLIGWTEPLFDKWENRPAFQVDPDNRWWTASLDLLEASARRGCGKYAISLPDLQGGGEILALLRGSERLALDLVDCPEAIPPALDEINHSWLACYQACFERIHRYQEGWVDWLGIWSETPAVTVECDFSVMISPRMFNRYFLPAVAQQAEWIGRTVFHLDGPGALPHLDALLDLPKLRAIQWVPTPDRPRQTEWIPLLRHIQAGGKAVVAACEPEEVLPLLEALDPRQILLSTVCSSPTEAETLVAEVRRRFGG